MTVSLRGVTRIERRLTLLCALQMWVMDSLFYSKSLWKPHWLQSLKLTLTILLVFEALYGFLRKAGLSEPKSKDPVDNFTEKAPNKYLLGTQ